MNSIINLQQSYTSSFQIFRISDYEISISGGSCYDIGNYNKWVPIYIGETLIKELWEDGDRETITLNPKGGYLVFKIYFEEVALTNDQWHKITKVQIIPHEELTTPTNFYFKFFAHYTFSKKGQNEFRPKLNIKKFYSSDLFEFAIPYESQIYKEYSPQKSPNQNGDILFYSNIQQLEGNILLLVKKYASYTEFDSLIREDEAEIKLSDTIFTIYYPDGTSKILK